MTNRINFSYNWNNKLTGKFFTTLRLKDDNRFRIGDIYGIELNRKLLFDAEIIDIRHFMLRDINNFVAGLDTGYTAEECRRMIMTMYKNHDIDWDKRSLSLILFRKMKVEKKQEEPQLQEAG